MSQLKSEEVDQSEDANQSEDVNQSEQVKDDMAMFHWREIHRNIIIERHKHQATVDQLDFLRRKCELLENQIKLLEKENRLLRDANKKQRMDKSVADMK